MTWWVPDSVWWDGRLHTGTALRDGVLTRVGDLPEDGERVRLPGTVLPGLGDAHVHSALVDVATLRAGGIAWAWDLGGAPWAVAAVAARHPWLRFAGPFLTAPGGYPSDRAWAPAGSCRPVRSVAGAAEAVGEAHAGGATLIKVTAHAGGPVLAPEVLAAVVDAAHARDLPVVVHAEGPGMVAAAYESGADLLAHTPWTEKLDDALVRACAARMTWISTLDIHGYGTPVPERATAVGNLRLFLEYGGKVRYGTDLGNGPLPPAINPREVRALQDAGLTPAEVLAAMADPVRPELSWLPGGLDLDPAGFAGSVATARVLGPEVRPRHIV
ncbi:amidohydrolase family protein [Actinoplanes sp. NPDC049681]|uniref:amidohydrolase family protein n=1 Tax=Actinoplanes sp. NPDC049681 TaxID=3363905 RepID=UPI00378CC824